eukprot:414680_1
MSVEKKLITETMVEIYDLEENQSRRFSEMNRTRISPGSYYNGYSDEIIVFGGWSYEAYPSQSMEIFDSHKHIWWDLPWETSQTYKENPVVWTVGG